MRRIEDPLFLMLHTSVRKLLINNNILCAEDLFKFETHKLIKLPGIGPKRMDEIYEFLYSLPFDYQNPDLPENPDQYVLAGLSPFTRKSYSGILNIWDDKLRERSLKYALEGRVSETEHDTSVPGKMVAQVAGSNRYSVRVEVFEHSMVSTCSCPFCIGFCKHTVAAVFDLAIQERMLRFQTNEASVNPYKKPLGILKLLSSREKREQVQKAERMSFVLQQKNHSWEILPLPVYEEYGSFPETGSMYRIYPYSNNPWDELQHVHPDDQLLVKLLDKKFNKEYQYSMGYRHFDNDMQNITIGSLLQLMRNRTVQLVREDEESRMVKITENKLVPFLEVSRSQDDGGLQLQQQAVLKTKVDGASGQIIDEYLYISEEPAFALFGNEIAEVEGPELALRFFRQTPTDIRISESELEGFLNDFYPELEKNGIPVGFDDIREAENSPEPEPRIYLSEDKKELIIYFVPAYNGLEISYNSENEDLLLPMMQPSGSPEIRRASRNREAEEQYYSTLVHTGLVPDFNIPSRLYSEFNPVNWVHEELPRLIAAGFTIYGEEKLRHNRPPRKMTNSSISVSSGENWFEIQGDLHFGNESVSLNEIWEVLGQNKTYVQLSDGTKGNLPEKWLHHLKNLLLLSRSDKTKQENTRVPRIAAPVLDELQEDADDWQADVDFEQYRNMLRNFDEIEQQEPPERFKGKLRSYQQGGLSWMMFLRSYKLGGVLADDMGLGKTVQVLALLQKIFELEGKKPFGLIVAPRSVIHNWCQEAASFTPEFSVMLHHGTGRAAGTEAFDSIDLIVTTYGTLMRDIELFSGMSFDYAILDESHTFRNPSSKISKAVRKIDAHNRLCLSGTPVQNSAQDLWAQFQFLNPGMLGSLKEFKSRWVKKTGLSDEAFKKAGETLQRMLKPFVLRRTKQQVATDLPELTNIQIDCPMETWQRNLYEKYRITYQKLVEDALEEEGIEKTRFRILEGLTRLRQLSCSPTLIRGLQKKISSKKVPAKVERFLELADELIQEGHKALVFSQFVTFLKELEDHIKQKGWSYEYLDGSTLNRQRRVDAFEGDPDKKLFLISLKAGGEGLNLTSADYVFIMDPWWNPAAERQAMDRTHRIGQTRQVFVYRLVAPDSVEEKILKLQQHKKDLSDKLISEDTGMFKELSANDLKDLFV